MSEQNSDGFLESSSCKQSHEKINQIRAKSEGSGRAHHNVSMGVVEDDEEEVVVGGYLEK